MLSTIGAALCNKRPANNNDRLTRLFPLAHCYVLSCRLSRWISFPTVRLGPLKVRCGNSKNERRIDTQMLSGTSRWVFGHIPIRTTVSRGSPLSATGQHVVGLQESRVYSPEEAGQTKVMCLYNGTTDWQRNGVN